jgi:hypothetical protein
MSELFSFGDPSTYPPPRRVICHWTGGGYTSTEYERTRYHALIEWDGNNVRVAGGVPIINNLHDLTWMSPTYKWDKAGYAAHTRGFNSWSLGYSICGMLGATDRDDLGTHPMVCEQVDALITLCAQSSVVFGLPVDEDHFFTHVEAQTIHGVAQPGKWDISYVPNAPYLEEQEVGPWLRQQIGQRV